MKNNFFFFLEKTQACFDAGETGKLYNLASSFIVTTIRTISIDCAFKNVPGVRGLAVRQESIEVQAAQMASQQQSNDRRLRCERRCSTVEKQTVL